MKKIKKIFTVLSLFILVASCTNEAKKLTKEDFIGVWEVEGNGEKYIDGKLDDQFSATETFKITFNADETGILEAPTANEFLWVYVPSREKMYMHIMVDSAAGITSYHVKDILEVKSNTQQWKSEIEPVKGTIYVNLWDLKRQ